jgi:hypothetical protein
MGVRDLITTLYCVKFAFEQFTVYYWVHAQITMRREAMADDEARYEELLSVPVPDKPTRWTTKKRRFCYHMARLGNASEASERAGYLNRDYGSILMGEDIVKEEVQKELRSLLDAETENEESVIARWVRWASVDVGDYFAEGWALNDISQLTEGQRKCIKKVKITHNQWGRQIDFELHDAHKANNDLAVMMGLLGKVEEGKTTPEETAKSIRQMLHEMEGVDGLQKPGLASSTGQPKRTH